MTIREEIENIIFTKDEDIMTDEILKLLEKMINDLEMEYRTRLIHELDIKVVFEDIRDILEGKTYKDVFYSDSI